MKLEEVEEVVVLSKMDRVDTDPQTWNRWVIFFVEEKVSLKIEARSTFPNTKIWWSKEEIEAHRDRYVRSKEEGIIIHPKMESSN